MYSRFQHTAARRRLDVSTASIFANTLFQHTAARRRLGFVVNMMTFLSCFNTQPPEGGWLGLELSLELSLVVSTHSRPKAAGTSIFLISVILIGFNTQPPEGGWFRQFGLACCFYSFNTQPPEGGWTGEQGKCIFVDCFNTQPPEGGWVMPANVSSKRRQFQHTAARRRLDRPS